MAHRHSSPADTTSSATTTRSRRKSSVTPATTQTWSSMTDRPLRVESNTMEGENPTGKLDPAVGLSILVVTMVVMVILGRISAVLCLFASFYLLPLLRVPARQLTDEGENTIVDEEEIPGLDVDLDSREHKKRVVLEGLLERKGRRP